MSWSATVRHDKAPAPGGLGFVQDLMNTVAAGKPRRDPLEDLAGAQAWLDQALTEWGKVTSTPLAAIELDTHDQEELRVFRDDLRRAAGEGDGTFPPLHAAAVAMRLGGNGEVPVEPSGTQNDTSLQNSSNNLLLMSDESGSAKP